MDNFFSLLSQKLTWCPHCPKSYTNCVLFTLIRKLTFIFLTLPTFFHVGLRFQRTAIDLFDWSLSWRSETSTPERNSSHPTSQLFAADPPPPPSLSPGTDWNDAILSGMLPRHCARFGQTAVPVRMRTRWPAEKENPGLEDTLPGHKGSVRAHAPLQVYGAAGKEGHRRNVRFEDS